MEEVKSQDLNAARGHVHMRSGDFMEEVKSQDLNAAGDYRYSRWGYNRMNWWEYSINENRDLIVARSRGYRLRDNLNNEARDYWYNKWRDLSELHNLERKEIYNYYVDDPKYKTIIYENFTNNDWGWEFLNRPVTHKQLRYVSKQSTYDNWKFVNRPENFKKFWGDINDPCNSIKVTYKTEDLIFSRQKGVNYVFNRKNGVWIMSGHGRTTINYL